MNKISTDEVRARYNGETMMEMGIYPEVWDDMESLEYLLDNFGLLKEFYAKAAQENQAVIFFVN